ncbi:hypothetical protein C7M61_000032 [Candidozyma pseudohaemuli]|uniref:Uncharacterized protein n=1 Tax=Candidozyma pseudohaemuli TaxID=418784 RepID=A0A2P7YWR1_9ASCO|nr:hypothetical protein C7M61_000032 [[Candida] pseudohaemulonii]PSK40397.1 hypothetical protein C7M61_000032 [[Candida] pseudohaemulonii]
MFFRCLVLFFTIASIVLCPWAIVGSYKNQSHLTENYLIGVQITGLDVGKLFAGANLKIKRDFANMPRNVDVKPTPTVTESLVTAFPKRDVVSDIESALGNVGGDITSAVGGINVDSLTAQVASATNDVNTDEIASKISELAASASIPDSLATIAAGLADGIDIQSVVSELDYRDLGLADYYSVSYWGYCRGYMNGVNGTDELLDNLGDFGKNFNKDDVKFVWCSSPKPGFKFDPLDLVKREMTNAVTNSVDGFNGLPQELSTTIKAQLLAIIASVDYEDLNLPGDLKDKLTLLNNITRAALAMLIAGTGLAFISFLFQSVGLCCSPNNSCLSCLNFILMLLFFLCILLGAGLSTGAYMFVRSEVNKEIDEFGLESFLSVQYYAFAWSAMVASFLAIVVAAVGYCCGCFSGTRRSYKRVQEPPMAYDHKNYGYH